MAASSNLHRRLSPQSERPESASAPARRVPMLIGGRDVEATSGATFERHSPVSGDLVTIATAASPWTPPLLPMPPPLLFPNGRKRAPDIAARCLNGLGSRFSPARTISPP